ncbi:MAG: hypothetical protein QOG80_2591, partial [Pseudonocardiales bacterium]|nr:hypothetical protein [Pseudonocardiales bacterium]
MRRHTFLRARLPIVAAASVAALVAGAVTSTAAANSPAAPGSNPAKALQAAKSKVPTRSGKGTARVMGNGRTPAGVPSKGNYAFLLQLAATPTMSTYDHTVAQGKSAAAAAARAQLRQVVAAQSGVVAALPTGSKVIYKTHAVLAGVAVVTDVRNYAALTRIGGVAAVYPIAPKTASNAYAVPLQGAPTAWTAHGDLGQNSTIAVIDTGIDYTHANFGGPGTSAAYDTAKATDNVAANPALFPSAKIIRGFDFAGDSYDADPTSPTYQPVPAPDPNPLDCAGHGSHVSGTAAGLGVTTAGTTYTGAYNTSTPFGSLRIGPGMAPKARLLAYKVFGCAGSTDVVGEGIDAAADPNGDGDTSDHAKVINMSLGVDYGSSQDGDSVASNAASALGISVVVASGNGGDFYDVGGSPGDAPRTIAAANSVDAQSILDALHVSAPAGIVGNYGAERSTAYDWAHKADLAGTLVALTDTSNADGCDPLSQTDAALVSGKVAFLDWTDDSSVRRCGSVTRSGHVQAAGAIGFVFAGDEETFAAGITGDPIIPGVLVTKSAGDTLRAHLGDPVVVSGTVANGFPQVITGNNDTVNTSSSRGVRAAGNVKPDVTAVGTSVFSTAMGTGSQGISFTGTSMATPMVAGLAALVNSEHPDWTPEEVKADIMNTAGQDLVTGQNHTGTKYAPNRVGAGRIQADAALDNNVLAYEVNDPGAVSVSFGPVAVTAPVTLTRVVRVVNKNIAPVSFTVAYQALTSVPGVNYTVSPSSLSIDGLSSKTFTVSFVVTDPTLLAKTIDPTMDDAQAGLPREFLADASGRVVLSPTSGTSNALRVPVYSAPRPASTMSNPSQVTMPSGSTQTAFVPLTGTGVDKLAGSATVVSAVAGFELQASSGLAPSCTATITSGCVHFADERSADLKYVGVTSDAPQVQSLGGDPLTDGMVYFSITAQGAWRTPVGPQEFDILIDTNGDNVPDAVVYNTRLSGQDIFLSELVDLTSGNVIDDELINNRFGDEDTAVFDSNTLVLPVAIGALPGIDGASHRRIRYGVLSFSNVASDP